MRFQWWQTVLQPQKVDCMNVCYFYPQIRVKLEHPVVYHIIIFVC